ATRPTRCEFDSLAFNVADLTQAPAQGIKGRRPGIGESRMEKPDHWNSLLLCACHNRPHRRTAEPRDERPSSHSMTSSARANKECGTSRSMALAVLRLMTNSNLTVCHTGMSAGFSPLRTRPA